MTNSTLRARARRAPHRLRRALAREDGWVDDVIVIIGVMVLLVLGIQAGTWYLGSNVAHSAAVAAYNSARSYQASDQDGSTAAGQVLGNFGTAVLGSPTVTVDRTATQVTVTVTGQPFHLIPGIPLPPISATETGPVERWVPGP